ncbi:DNA-methyltransferase [Chloroflexota bacterium]
MITSTANLVEVLPPQDVFDTIASVREPVVTTILDPWYNKGIGGICDNYREWLDLVVLESSKISQHIFVWGFPEIVYTVLESVPTNFTLITWLTWYYKNCPTVNRGWRPAQYTCLHLARKEAKLYPEHFLNDVQREKDKVRKLRYFPGPPTVIDAPLNIGFVGKKEQTGHPAQKPIKVIEPLILMTTQENDLVLDPMCGAGTTGVVCEELNRRAILGDISEQWIEVTKNRIIGK